MTSSAQRGAYYKARTRRWLEAKGYQVADLEVVRWVGWPERFAVKRDQLGSDLLAMNAAEILFVQVKGASAARGNFPEARRTFALFQWAPQTRRVVIAWLRGAREPRVVEM